MKSINYLIAFVIALAAIFNACDLKPYTKIYKIVLWKLGKTDKKASNSHTIKIYAKLLVNEKSL